jgi:hypothetical protein
MNMPGFTAEASLRSITSVYRAAASIRSKTEEVEPMFILCSSEASPVIECCVFSDVFPYEPYRCTRTPNPLPELFPVFPQPT